MIPVIKRLEKAATQAISTCFQGEEIAPYLPAEVTQSTQPQFGHYQCNTPLRMAKGLKKNPREIASTIADALKEQNECIEKVEVAGPGFINITLTASFLEKELEIVSQDEHLGVPIPEKKQKVVVEFSSPNVAKELHVGHLRSTIIGESIARIFEFLGHDVLRLNHVGDWGTQFGMLITYMQEVVPEVFEGKKESSLAELMDLYRASKKRFDEDEGFKKRAQLKVVDLQGGDPEAKKAWERICEISRVGFEEIYDMLDVTLIERGESFYNAMLAPVVEDALTQGIARESDGAVCIFMDGFQGKDGDPLPMIIRKSDGGFNYDTTDLAALKYRVENDKADRIICITDAGQKLHFDMLFKAGALLGYYDPKKVHLDHVTFGVVLGPDGKKFKTRSGETEKLVDLINGAVQHADTLLQQRDPDLSAAERKTRAEVLGIDAIKYADLSGHRSKDYVFSYDRMLKFEGNTAVFLLYAYVRVQGIKRKVKKDISHGKVVLNHPSELSLGLHIRQFPEVLAAVEKDLLPHRLCEYLYTLAEKFNAFFRDCRVEGSEYEDSRLLLSSITAGVLEKGLHLLGLKTLDRM